MKKIKVGKNKILKFYTVKETFKKTSGSGVFQSTYNEELARLRLANQIKNIRLKRKLTQKDVAERAAMPQSVIARIESGAHSFSIGTLSRIAKVFNKELELV